MVYSHSDPANRTAHDGAFYASFVDCGAMRCSLWSLFGVLLRAFCLVETAQQFFFDEPGRDRLLKLDFRQAHAETSRAVKVRKFAKVAEPGLSLP